MKSLPKTLNHKTRGWLVLAFTSCMHYPSCLSFRQGSPSLPLYSPCRSAEEHRGCLRSWLVTSARKNKALSAWIQSLPRWKACMAASEAQLIPAGGPPSMLQHLHCAKEDKDVREVKRHAQDNQSGMGQKGNLPKPISSCRHHTLRTNRLGKASTSIERGSLRPKL